MLCNDAAFVPSSAREGLAAPALRLVTRLALKSTLSPGVPLDRQRQRIRRVARTLPLARHVDIEPGKAGTIPGEWLRPRAANSKAAVLYLHGGAYCIGSPKTHRGLTSHLARAAGLPVFAAAYRLAPDHPFPAALDDAVAACRALGEAGLFAVAGDSAGAGLAVAAALSLRDRRATPPVALTLFSPWVDLTLAQLSDNAAPNEVMLSTSWLGACAGNYLAGGNASDPRASPVLAELHDLPSTLIQASPGELLHSDAIRLHDTLDQAGVDVRCELIAGRWHEFQLQAGMLPSARMALERAAGFIRDRIPALGSRH
jgi:monoterpene epsilon-lactone hydrolase